VCSVKHYLFKSQSLKSDYVERQQSKQVHVLGHSSYISMYTNWNDTSYVVNLLLHNLPVGTGVLNCFYLPFCWYWSRCVTVLRVSG